ncbi:MAG: HAD family phosphatase [Winogradskyella sp.]|uniref:HAD-IA family hydrolase n=1 Tax=Winogradskyella sp. TaxID=1883156 RepID=UPI000F3BE040|nr:HAD-IA family hydrolase [Winogradskyella sp.]RNC79771.1 MAG: HAD family phosphatase [Winogradskyella sp.]
MIKTLIFDFGDVFINLDKSGAMAHALELFRLEEFETDMWDTNMQYEVGKISTSQFLEFYTNKFNYLSEEEVIHAWNYIIKDFPEYRLEFIKNLARKKDYKLILLSNTNEMHIDFIKQNVDFYEAFKACFNSFYLSHEIAFRKPNANTFEFVLIENKLNADECLFIDDTKENTDAARQLGFNVWNIDETKEDVVNLFKINKHLF